jgi:hypothetical protein
MTDLVLPLYELSDTSFCSAELARVISERVDILHQEMLSVCDRVLSLERIADHMQDGSAGLLRSVETLSNNIGSQREWQMDKNKELAKRLSAVEQYTEALEDAGYMMTYGGTPTDPVFSEIVPLVRPVFTDATIDDSPPILEGWERLSEDLHESAIRSETEARVRHVRHDTKMVIMLGVCAALSLLTLVVMLAVILWPN